MLKKLYFVATGDYDMVVSVDGERNCRYLTETIDFPVLSGMDMDQKEREAMEFLESVEDDSSWNDDCTYDQIFYNDMNVIVEIEKEI